MNDLDEIRELEEAIDLAPPPELKPTPDHPVCFSADSKYPLLMLNHHRARLWVQLDDGLQVEALSDLSPLADYQHSLDTYCNECGLDDLVRDDTWTHGAEHWALCEGLIAYQPFQIEVYVRFYIHRGWEGDEGDCETEVKFLKIEPVDPIKAAEFWEERFSVKDLGNPNLTT